VPPHLPFVLKQTTTSWENSRIQDSIKGTTEKIPEGRDTPPSEHLPHLPTLKPTQRKPINNPYYGKNIFGHRIKA
jgi:hypothetical protein